jgi:hypothetical protein
MARKYAISGLPGLNADIKTYVNGEYIPPGSPLPEGAKSFDLIVHYTATRADVAAGATPGSGQSIALVNVPISASITKIKSDVLAARAQARYEETFGYKSITLNFGDGG